MRAIFAFLVRTQIGFGHEFEDAKSLAAKRLGAITAAMAQIGDVPHQGTRRDAMIPGLRSVTKDRAVFYFTVDDDAQVVRVLAVFFGGQDHQDAMVRRLMTKR